MLITIFVSVVAPIVVGVILELVKDWLKTDVSAINPHSLSFAEPGVFCTKKLRNSQFLSSYCEIPLPQIFVN
ncbi:type I toxin-antitoxin system Fst family toxin [Lentzea sp. NPDC003310]|uniref:type I toxin-antitoxin system Fst family toxin n=1 Tax=Lentzea sp. NPDC003310 TaxID=3154447 RepID=UPI0033B0A354